MTIITDLNNTIREEELKDVYVLVERTGHIEGYSLKHVFTNIEDVQTFDSKNAVQKYAERHGLIIKNV